MWGKDIVQHKGKALGRSKPVQDHQQRQTHRVGQLRFFLGVDQARLSRDGLEHGRFQRLLAPQFARQSRLYQVDPVQYSDPVRRFQEEAWSVLLAPLHLDLRSFIEFARMQFVSSFT